jgi:hypothetical protein
MVGSFLIVLSFLLFSRFLGLFGGSVIDRHLDQIVKGAVSGQFLDVLGGPLLFLFCHILKIRRTPEESRWEIRSTHRTLFHCSHGGM